MAEQQRIVLESLMGKETSIRRKDPEMTNPKVCRSFLVGTCPHDLFIGTKQDLGECPMLHLQKHKLEYEYLTKKLGEKFPELEYDYYKQLQSYIHELGRNIAIATKRLEHTPEEKLKIEKVKQKYAFLHGDLHFKNMLVDENGKVSGIIDWGDINIGHPACDLNVVYSFLPPYARSNFFKEYGEVDEETKILARLIAIYIPILIMIQAIDHNDERLIDEAKANIKRALAD